LIALIINAHPAQPSAASEKHSARRLQQAGKTLIERPAFFEIVRRRAVKLRESSKAQLDMAHKPLRRATTGYAIFAMSNRHSQRNLLFTMSDNTHRAARGPRRI
jgi:hypothetical protein